jgi:GT2 family glycosyltransferase
MCLESLFGKTAYPNLEVICMDNGTTDERALRTIGAFPVQRIVWPGGFNFSAVNNLAVRRSAGEFIVTMNNDVETITPDWVEQMLFYARQEDVGAVGGLLLYPDRTVQHAGVVLGCRGTADHVLRGATHDSDGYAGSISCAREVSAVTAACIMVRRSVYEEAGGFNEHFFTAYQDVDFCLKIARTGKRNIYTPRAVFVHHESASRGGYYDMVDRNLLLDLWEPEIQMGDPFFNRNFDVQACDYSLRRPV